LKFLLLFFIFISTIPFSFADSGSNEEFNLDFYLILEDCNDNEKLTEFIALIEISYYYINSFDFQPVFLAYCLSPDEFYGLESSNIKNTPSVVMFDYELWSNSSYEIFGYEPPENILKTSGEIFFEDKLILMSFSLDDDYNAPILTHELLHFILWQKGFSEDVFIDDVHRDWYQYILNYENGEKSFSMYADKYYYIFG